MLHRMKTKNGHVRDAADSTAAVFRAQRMTSVFDDGQSVPFSDLENCVHIGGVAGIVDRENYPCFRIYFCSRLLRIKIQRVAGDVREDWPGSQVERTVSCGAEGHGRGNSFVPLLKPSRESSCMERGRARTETHCVLRAHPRCKTFFELANFGSSGKPIRSQHVDDSLDIVFIERLPTVGEQRRANGRSPVDG